MHRTHHQQPATTPDQGKPRRTDWSRLFTATLLASTAVLAHSAIAAPAFEQPPTLSAAKLSPNTPLKGKVYQVDNKVPTDGFLAHYTIKSDFGSFRAVGPGNLDVAINEIKAIAALRQIEGEDQLKKGATESANDVVTGVKSFIDKPEETIQGIPDGVGRFFKRSYRNVKTGVQKVQDRHQGRAAGAPPAGPGANLPGASSNDNTTVPQGNVYVEATQALGSATIDVLGFSDDRRRLARELGVDPYTTNPILDKELDQVTWAAFAGNLGVSIATSVVPGGVLLSSSQHLSNWVYDTPPGDLRLGIEKNLLGMGVSQHDVDLLLRHRWYPLSLQAALVAALKDLDGVSGRKLVMPLALTVTSHEQADYVVETLRMLSQYHHRIKPLQTLAVVGTVIANTSDGELVITAPVDYLIWSPTVARFLDNKGLDAKRHSLYLAGDISATARQQLQQAGWQVHANSGLFIPIITASKTAT